MPSLDVETVRRSLALARGRGLARIDLSAGGTSLSATFLADWQPADTEGAAPFEDAVDAGPPVHEVTAPVVGYFRPAAELKSGDRVEVGQSVGEVVALGISNEIGSPVEGVFDAYLVDGDAPVEFGQPVARMTGT